MKKPHKPTWNPENVFTGTAWYYARYRPTYPDRVFTILKNKYRLDESSRVLDLGCGTGQVALQLAPHVAEIIAIDPQEEMLQEGKSAAATRNITNIKWIKGESGKLPNMVAKIGKLDLTVIARAFHWMDREQTLADLYKIIVPGGGLAVIGDSDPTDGATVPWREISHKTVKKWLGTERRAGTDGTYTPPERRFEEYLKESKFSNYELATFRQRRVWSVDNIIGYVFSTSLASPPVLGDKKDRFEADLRRRLLKINPEGVFKETENINIMMVWKSSK